MLSQSELTQILYEISMATGGSTNLQSMLDRSIRAFVRKLSALGAVVLARRPASGEASLEYVHKMPRNLLRNAAYGPAIEALARKDIHAPNHRGWYPPEAVAVQDIWMYRFSLPDYGILVLLKATPLHEAVAGSLRQVCHKLAESCIACETAAALKESRENLRVTLHSIGDAVIATDRMMRVTEMNRVAQEITGWPLAEARQQLLDQVFQVVRETTREPVENIAKLVLETGKTIELEHRALLICRDGTERQVADSAAPILNASGNIIGVVLVFRDVTKENALQERLAQTQKMESIGRLAGGVAHDFNNMLSGILGYGELLTRQLTGAPKLLQYAENIRVSAERAGDLTKKLLSFSRKGKTLSTPLDIHSVIQEAVGLLICSIDRRIAVTMELKATQSTVVGDPAQLQNAILNLGINARDALPEGGQVVVSTENVILSESECHSGAYDILPGRYLRLCVSDNGTGMTSDILDKVFEPFFTTKEVGMGTGLGLSAVYGTIKDHSGAVAIESEPGQGTLVSLFLPLAAEEEASPKQAPIESLLQFSACVLVVDDEPVLCSMMGDMLSELGCEVLFAQDGEAGLALYKEHQRKIDLVFLDTVMPKMNGRDLFRAIRAFDPQARICLTSGFARETAVSDLNEEGLLGFLAKPFTTQQLCQAIHTALGK